MIYRSIIVAFDGSEQSRAALAHATELARDQHAHLTLITVVPPVSAAGTAGTAQVAPFQEDCFRGALDDAAAAVPDDIGLVRILAHGKPAREIAERVEQGDFDLVVMGTHGRSRVGEAMLGSVSRETLRHVSTPVLLVRS